MCVGLERALELADEMQAEMRARAALVLALRAMATASTDSREKVRYAQQAAEETSKRRAPPK